jgi:hypothetical protein
VTCSRRVDKPSNTTHVTIHHVHSIGIAWECRVLAAKQCYDFRIFYLWKIYFDCPPLALSFLHLIPLIPPSKIMQHPHSHHSGLHPQTPSLFFPFSNLWFHHLCGRWWPINRARLLQTPRDNCGSKQWRRLPTLWFQRPYPCILHLTVIVDRICYFDTEKECQISTFSNT